MNAKKKTPSKHQPRQYYQIEIWRGCERLMLLAITSRRPTALIAFAIAARMLPPGQAAVLRSPCGGVLVRHEAVEAANDNHRRDRDR